MSGLAFLAIAVVLSVIGITIVVLRNRTSGSDVAKVDAFKREMDALSPRHHDGDEGPPKGKH